MIFAKVAPENTPRCIWDEETGENLSGRNVDERSSSDEEKQCYKNSSRYKRIKCFDVRPMQNHEEKDFWNKNISSQSNFVMHKNMHGHDIYRSEDANDKENALGEPSAVEELWIVGKRQVEWRIGGKPIKRFSGQETALQAMWTTFSRDCKAPMRIMDCIVIREKERLRIYSNSGTEFLVALPFPLCNIWNTRYGLLLERSGKNLTKTSAHPIYSSHVEVTKDKYEVNRIKPPRLMALHHPLDDLTRIVIKTGGADNTKFCEWNSNRHKILFTCTNPSICVTFDRITCFHNIWLIRQICETDEFDQDLIKDATQEINSLNKKEPNNSGTSPIQAPPSQQQQPNLISNLLNSTRLKQFQRKQNTPSSGIPSASCSPSLLSANCSPNSARPTPNISANSCVTQHNSQYSPTLHGSMNGVTGTSTRKHTPITAGIRTFSFACPDSPMTPQNQSVHNATPNISTREFMMRQGTPVRASNPNFNTQTHKLSNRHTTHGTPFSRLSHSVREGQGGLHGATSHTVQNTGAHHNNYIASNNATTDGSNKFMASRECDFGGNDQPLAPDFSICLDHLWSEEYVANQRMQEGYPIEDVFRKDRDSSNQATKVFLSKDVIGVKYICFFNKNQGVIHMLPYYDTPNVSQDNMPPLTFGNFSHAGSILNQRRKQILDAVPVDSLGMILTLERNLSVNENIEEAGNHQQFNNICLYSGCVNQSTSNNKVADVHIEPTYSGNIKKADLANIAHEISILHLGGKPERFNCHKSNNDKRKISRNEKNSTSEYAKELEKREIVTSSRPPSATEFPVFNESILSMLSPVAKSDPSFQAFPSTASGSNSNIQNAGNAKTSDKISHVEYGAYSHVKLFYNDLRLQLTLPPICTSSMVQRCLSSLCAYLPNRLSLALATQWYRMRNAPGPSSISASEEWKLFIKCLFGQMGYHVDKLKPDIFSITTVPGSRNNSSMSPVCSKKMRPDESGSDADWQVLLEGRPHIQSGEQISFLLGIKDVTKTQKSSTIDNDKSINVRDNLSIRVTEMDVETVLVDPDAILFEHIGSILWCLHLLYEDFKVDKSSQTYLSPMAMALSKLAGDLNLAHYVEHYWKDFPIRCSKVLSFAQTGQMPPQYLPVISRPFVILKDGNTSLTTKHTKPPCIYSYLTELVDNSGKCVKEPFWGHTDDRYEILPDRATQKSRDLIIIYAILSFQNKRTSPDMDMKLNISEYVKISKYSTLEDMESPLSDFVELVKMNGVNTHQNHKIDVASSIVRFIVDNRYNAWNLMNSFPVVLGLPIFAAIFECRLNPRLKDSNWAKQAYELIGRPDLAKRCLKSVAVVEPCHDNISTRTKINIGQKDENRQSNLQRNFSASAISNAEKRNGLNAIDNTSNNTVYDGLESVESDITLLRWPKDRRLADVRRMLQSARPVIIDVEQRPEMSDHDFLEVQERALQSLCVRTMALSIGRGALGFRTTDPLPTETLPVPKLCLSGRAPPRGATVEMDHIDVVPNMERWPSFHNGVAAGLRIAKGAGDSYIDSNWITFNKPKDSSANPNELVEHGGFLMALGLNGQLGALGKLESFDYLIRGNDMISIGILLGTCAAKRGSMDILATKKIATQVEALLPSTATELPLSNTTQVAGLAGLGLLYQGTGHRQMSEVCLMELGRPPGPEMENCTDRESYSLSAGLALGMITLGKGEVLNKGPLSDLRLPETLYHHMVGGPRSPSVYRHRFRSPSSYQIQEGDSINIDITSPGATLALGLMFFNTGNQTYANWMNAPDSQFLLEFVRPDFLMVRTLAKGLIMWDSILPNSEWIDSHVPPSIRSYCLRRPGDEASTGQVGPRGIRGAVDYETINQAYCNIVAGAALSMGLRFAGSNNAQAFEVLHRITLRLLAISKRSVAELAGKATIEQTICVLVLSLAIVAAGSGDLEVIKIIRFLRSRVGPKNPTVTYGSHMALHMALGLLFLGGGRYTLSTSPLAVAAMVAAFFPKFPTHSNDNRYHLQALRHLYVLATEPRLLIPRDIHSGRFIICHIELELKDTNWYKRCTYTQKAPVFLPELKYLKKVSIKDPRYHEMIFCIDLEDNYLEGKTEENINNNNFAQLQALLLEGYGILDIQQKAGSLSYQDDPQGFRSLTGQYLTKNTSFRWSMSLNSSRLLSTFSLEPAVATFTNLFIKRNPQLFYHCGKHSTMKISAIEQIMASILYECASQEKLDMLPFYIQIFQDLWNIGKPGQLLLGHQIRMLVKLTAQKDTDRLGERGLVNRLVNPEIISSVYQGLQYNLDMFLTKYGVEGARQFLASGKFDNQYLQAARNKDKKEEQFSYQFFNADHMPWNHNALSSLLVLNHLMAETSDKCTEKLSLHFSKEISPQNTSNQIEKLLNSKLSRSTR